MAKFSLKTRTTHNINKTKNVVINLNVILETTTRNEFFQVLSDVCFSDNVQSRI